jgi:hypothetical protein
MTGDYSNILADCANVATALKRTTAYLQRHHDLCNDGEHDPFWSVMLDHAEVERLMTFLDGVHGLLWHLGNEPRAAEALLIAHKGEAWAETFLRIAAANAATEEGAPAEK